MTQHERLGGPRSESSCPRSFCPFVATGYGDNEGLQSQSTSHCGTDSESESESHSETHS